MQPQELDKSLFDNLDSAFNIAFKQIQQCDDQINLWKEHKQKIQNKLNDAIGKITEPIESEKNITISDMIQEFLEKNGPARTTEIRKYLIGKGRNTNPGVALSRMVKGGTIKNIKRGLYKL